MSLFSGEDLTITNVRDLAASDRLREIAGLLAVGILRLRYRAALPGAPALTTGSKNLPDSSLNCLELPGETRLSGPAG
jgi:hypothetical protein